MAQHADVGPRALCARFQRLVVLAFAGLVFSSTVEVQPASGQVGDASTDEYEIVRPQTCATQLRGGLPGWLFGYEYAGHSWTASWDRSFVLSASYDLAKYVPALYDGYASMKGDYI